MATVVKTLTVVDGVDGDVRLADATAYASPVVAGRRLVNLYTADGTAAGQTTYKRLRRLYSTIVISGK